MAFTHILSMPENQFSSNTEPRSQGFNVPNPAWGRRQMSSWEEGDCWSLRQSTRPANISISLAVSGEESAAFSHVAIASVIETAVIVPLEFLKS